jgi:hypothetical protein
MRNLLLNSHNKKHPAYMVLQKLFAIVFFVARLGMGIPVSVVFWRDMLRLLRDGTGHSNLVICYYLLANITLNSLNVIWFIAIVKKGMAYRSAAASRKPKRSHVPNDETKASKKED